MVQSCLLGTAILRTQRSRFLQAFCRYKSITAAIERGRRNTSREHTFGTTERTKYRVNSLGRDRATPPTTPKDRFSRDVGSSRYRDRRNGHERMYQRDDGSSGWRSSSRQTENRPSGSSFKQRHTGDSSYLPPSSAQTLGYERVSIKGIPKRESPNERTFKPRQLEDMPQYIRSERARELDGHGERKSTARGERPHERTPRPAQLGDMHRDGGSERVWVGGPRERSSRPGQMDDRRRDIRSEQIPESLPYATAASQFLYGYSSVLAAIKANRRKLYKLYIHNRGLNHEGRDAVVQNARAIRLAIQEVGDEYLRVFDKASNGRPHNGFILESSPLPVPPITELRSSSMKSGTFELTLDKQSKEDALINGTKDSYSYGSAGWRHPLVLYVDGVLDEGNLGATARSAYFLGVDAIVTPSRQSAPWSHIALKASAGAAEAIPIFQANRAADFLGRSAREGWRIYASDAIPPAQQRPHSVSSPSVSSIAEFASSVIYTYAKSAKRLPAEHCPVESHPTILMMGAEGTGLRSSLLNMAHYKVGIRHGRDVDEVGVDSLNVSVAASLLCYEMLRKPKPRRKAGDLMF